MRRYVLATQRAWGRRVFDLVSRPTDETWACRHFEPEDPDATDAGRLEALCAQMAPRYVFLVDWLDAVPPGVYGRLETVGVAVEGANLVAFRVMSPDPLRGEVFARVPMADRETLVEEAARLIRRLVDGDLRPGGGA